ncbi:MAG: LysM peptidoglycan-binding domain-containing protein [Desulfosporosinus sp.]|jgi:LysM repeat protein
MEYCIQPGDSFYNLAQRWGGTCDDFLRANPYVDPLKLQIGQKIVLPELKSLKGQEQYAEISTEQGQQFAGDYLDNVEMEVEGVRFRLRRIGEPKVPHEVHFILPRTEIRKIQPAGEGGPCEVQIMLSNLNVILSPRLMSGQIEQPQLMASPQYDQREEQPALEQSREFAPAEEQPRWRMSFPLKKH